MAGNPIPMRQLKQLLRLLSRGSFIKGTTREPGVSITTIKGYLRAIEPRGLADRALASFTSI